MKRYKYCALCALFAFLATCEQRPASATPAKVDVNTISTQAVATIVSQMTEIAATQTTAVLSPTATLTETPWPTITPQPTPTPGPTLPPLPLVTVDGLRVAYIIGRNLYVQDSGKEIVQSTFSSEDRNPIFSDDGQKIVFIRGSNTVYSINANSGQEQVLITPDLLAKLGYAETSEANTLAFVPGTHHLLFNTRDFKRSSNDKNADLLLVDTDNAEIKVLLLPGQGGFFQTSPNGKLIALIKAGSLNVIGLDGKALYQNLAVIPPIPEDVWPPIIQWTQDSSRLFNAPLDPTAGAQGGYLTEPRTLWQYAMNSGAAREIRLGPPLMGNMFSISPDGNWVVYTFFDPLEETKETSTPGIYLANLHNGKIQFLGNAGLDYLPSSYTWNSDSTHFIFDDERDKMYLGDIHGEVVALNSWNFLNWIDASRYLCLYRGLTIGEIGKDAIMRVVETPAGMFDHFNHLNFVFVKPGSK